MIDLSTPLIKYKQIYLVFRSGNRDAKLIIHITKNLINKNRNHCEIEVTLFST